MLKMNIYRKQTTLERIFIVCSEKIRFLLKLFYPGERIEIEFNPSESELF